MNIYAKSASRDVFGLPIRIPLEVVPYDPEHPETPTRRSNNGHEIAKLSDGREVDLDELRARGRTVVIGAKRSGNEPVDMADEVHVEPEAP